MGNITKELYGQVLRAKSVEEVSTFAKDAGVELAEGEAEKLFDRLHGRDVNAISDEELDNVSGGICGRPVDSGVSKCGFGFYKCYKECEFFEPDSNDPNKGLCLNVPAG